jgi:hypothetical protein
MRKIICLILVFRLVNSAYAQSPEINQASTPWGELEIECYKECTTEENHLKFIISLRNNLRNLIKIPAELVDVPNNSIPRDIAYEIQYCSGADTVNVFDSVIVHTDAEYSRDRETDIVRPGDKYFFECYILKSKFIFNKSGTYRARFTLFGKIITPAVNANLTTDWVFFYL